MLPRNVMPYSKDTLFSHMYKYEGMANLPKPLTSEEFNNAVKELNGSNPKNEEKNELNKQPKKVEGFALQPAPFGDSKVLDRYSSTPSGPQCFGRSSGYSNSLGPLCLSQEDERLLSTRGGNISGTDSTIGR